MAAPTVIQFLIMTPLPLFIRTSARKSTPVPPKNHSVPYFLDAPSPDVQRLAQLHFSKFLRSSSSSALTVNSLEDIIRSVYES